MNSHSKFPISILFTVVLSTGFLSIAYVQRAYAFSIDFSGLPGFGDNQGLNFLQGPKGVKGDKVFNDSAQKSVATCDTDEVLTGGGLEHFGASYHLLYSKPVGNSWKAKSLPMSQDP